MNNWKWRCSRINWQSFYPTLTKCWQIQLHLALISRGILYLLGCGGHLIGCVRAMLCMRSVHLFCETERSAEWSGLCSLKLVTTIPTNSWRPMFTPTKTNTCKYIFRNCRRERNTSLWLSCDLYPSCDLHVASNVIWRHHVTCTHHVIYTCNLHTLWSTHM